MLHTGSGKGWYAADDGNYRRGKLLREAVWALSLFQGSL